MESYEKIQSAVFNSIIKVLTEIFMIYIIFFTLLPQFYFFNCFLSNDVFFIYVSLFLYGQFVLASFYYGISGNFAESPWDENSMQILSFNLG